MKLRERPEYVVKPKASERFQDTKEGAKLWLLLTPEEQKARNEKWEKDNQAALDKSENARRLKELEYNVDLKPDTDLSE